MAKEKQLRCPKCKRYHINVQAVNEVKEVKKKGCGYWLFIGWWLEPLEIFLFGILKLLHIAVGRKNKDCQQHKKLCNLSGLWLSVGDQISS